MGGHAVETVSEKRKSRISRVDNAYERIGVKNHESRDCGDEAKVRGGAKDETEEGFYTGKAKKNNLI